VAVGTTSIRVPFICHWGTRLLRGGASDGKSRLALTDVANRLGSGEVGRDWRTGIIIYVPSASLGDGVGVGLGALGARGLCWADLDALRGVDSCVVIAAGARVGCMIGWVWMIWDARGDGRAA